HRGRDQIARERRRMDHVHQQLDSGELPHSREPASASGKVPRDSPGLDWPRNQQDPGGPGFKAARGSQATHYRGPGKRIAESGEESVTNGWKRKAQGGVLAFIGFMLSPLSWWNDLFVNVPLAVGFAWLVAFFYRPAFESAVIIGYWLTNLIG